MKMSPVFSMLAVCALCLFCVSEVSTQGAPVLCDTAGCKNGECIQPGGGAAAYCNCTVGFQTVSDVNVCEDIDECYMDMYKCGGCNVQTECTWFRNFPYVNYNPAFWPFIPAGRCVNVPGSYYCLCYPPTRPNFQYNACKAPPKQQQNPQDSLRNILLLRSLDIEL